MDSAVASRVGVNSDKGGWEDFSRKMSPNPDDRHQGDLENVISRLSQLG